MAVLQMQRISICALKKDRKAILEKLQSMGVMEIVQTLEDDEDFQKMDTAGERVAFERQAQVADQALDILQVYVPQKQSMLSSLEGKKLIEKDVYEKAASSQDEIMHTAAQLVAMNKEIAENKANILKLENQMESLVPWMSLDVSMDYEGTSTTAMFVGTMSNVTSLDDVYAAVAEHAPDAVGVDITKISEDRDCMYLAVLCLKKDASQVEEALRVNGFARPSALIGEEPSVMKKELEEEIQKLNDKNQEIEKAIADFGKARDDLQLISDYYRMRAEKYDILGELPQSKKTFVVSGYVPQKAVAAVEKAMSLYDCAVETEELAEEEEAPVLLQNNAFSECVEGVLASYGLPKKGEVDPTTIMSFFYVFFFGLMLSDAAYGFLIAVVCFVILKKFPRMDRGMFKSMKMFMWCGVSTMIWGILFGGYFGDVVDVVARTFFHVDVPETGMIKALWFVPLNDPMRMLIYSMAFGLVHLFVGLGIKGYMLIRDKKYLDCFCDVGLWAIFLLGLLLMLIPSDIFASIAQAKIVFPPALNTLAKGMAIVGVLGLILMSGRSSKNWGLRIALGAYDVYNVTGWLSDILSYSRLLALGLATGVIASVVNQMGSMFGDSILGVIGFILVFIVGHALNMAINILGAYVHTNRLQFVEFFGKFYEGGGRPFNPFHASTKYVDIKEETYL
ncbi:MAG: V-type ATP synthase subunit I [Lachnospiraceae bacterium]|jgi:V/A-type H+-transporting ATPase subunit I